MTKVSLLSLRQLLTYLSLSVAYVTLHNTVLLVYLLKANAGLLESFAHRFFFTENRKTNISQSFDHRAASVPSHFPSGWVSVGRVWTPLLLQISRCVWHRSGCGCVGRSVHMLHKNCVKVLIPQQGITQ